MGRIDLSEPVPGIGVATISIGNQSGIQLIAYSTWSGNPKSICGIQSLNAESKLRAGIDLVYGGLRI